jgi:hypothetical protein
MVSMNATSRASLAPFMLTEPLAVLGSGCATFLAAAATGGDREAMVTGARIDGAIAGAAVASAVERRRERMRRRYARPPFLVVQQAPPVVVVEVHQHGVAVRHEGDNAKQLAPSPFADEASGAEAELPLEPPREAVLAQAKEQLGETERCRSRLRNPDAGHVTTVWFDVEPSGRIESVETRNYEPPALRRCLEEVISTWTFSPSKHGARVKMPVVW